MAEYREMKRVDEALTQSLNHLAAAARRRAGGKDEECVCAISSAAEKLRGCLREHFRLEDEDGYLEPVTERRPTLSGRVDRLHQEHEQILAQLESLQTLCGGGGDLAAATAAVRRTLDLIRSHGDEECCILQEVMTDDIGAGD